MYIEKRAIRSFVRRERHRSFSPALEKLWEKYGVKTDRLIYLKECFLQPEKSVVLDIGFGKGKSLLKQASTYTNQNYLGIEVYRTGIFSVLSEMSINPLDNVRLIEGDAAEILPKCFLSETFSKIQILFPDPWPKKRHHKRRLIQIKFVKLLHTLLKQNGELHLATDWSPYALHMLNTINKVEGFINTTANKKFSAHSFDTPMTIFEKRGLNLGHQIFHLRFKKCQ